jgi:hypothetical protein
MAKKPSNSTGYDASSLRDFDDYEGALNSITNQLGKQDEVYKRINTNLKDTKALVGSIANKIEQATDLEEKHKKQIENAAKAYKDSKKTIAESLLQYKKRDISQKEYNELVLKARDNYADVVSKIDSGNKSAARTIKTFKKVGQELDAFADAAEKSKKKLEGIETAIDHIGGAGVEGVRELGDVLKSAANGGKGLTTALSVAAGALAAMAYNYGLIGDKVGTIAKYDKDIIGVQGSIDATNKQISMGVDLPTYDKAGKNITGTFKAVNYVAKQAMLDFSTTVQQMGASFQAASKTALFGNKLGGVGYAASSLQMAGISAENIAESMQAASDATGKMPTGKMAADMSIIAQRTGQSTESIATINETFQRLDKVSEKTALNLQEGVRAMADKAGVNLGSAMAEIAEASKDALSYQIKGSSQLAKQVIYAKSLGVSFNDVAKAGQNMVLNYKDSIKSEMSLSAMLGKNVNLSEVRAKFMSGDNEGAMKALKAQGLNPKDMNMFQQQALQQALGGMDLNSIQKITENTGKSSGELKEGKAGGANAQYLAAKTAAEASLAATNAMISAQAELKSIKLSTEEQQQLQTALIENVNKVATETNNKAQLEALKTAETALTAAIIGLTVAIGTQMLGNFLSKPGSFKDKVKSLNPFGKSTPTTNTSSGPLTKSGNVDMRYKANKMTGTDAIDDISKVASKGAKFAKFAKGLGVVGTVVGAGFDFKNRKDEGQTNTQAVAGTGAGVGGALGGAALGAAIGSAVPIVGTIIGGLIGGALGALGASKAADKITGVGKKPTAAPTKMESKPTVTAPIAAGVKPVVVSKEEQAKPIETGTKPTVEAVNTMGQAQIDAQKMAADKAKVTLTETQYSTKLQQEMVAMLGLSTQILNKIMENTANGGDITLDGKTIRNSLLNQARINYGVGRTA